jgi:hypothetical protein
LEDKDADGLTALNLSLQENLKHRNLTGTEIAKTLKRIYEEWIKKKSEAVLKYSLRIIIV